MSRGSGIVGTFVRHPNAANLLMALMLIMGVFGIIKINTQFFPTVTVNQVGVSVQWPGASAEQVADNILNLLEPELRFIEGVQEITSYARENGASISLKFEDGTDLQQVFSEIEQAVAAVDTLPTDSEPPVVTLGQDFDIVGKIAISGPFSEAALNRFARVVRNELIAEGIDSVAFDGSRATEYRVIVDPLDLRRLELTVGDIARRIAQNSGDAPSGSFEGRLERQVRVIAEADAPNTIGLIEVLSTSSGDKVRVRDMAEVMVGSDDNATRGMKGGVPAVELIVQRSPESDVIAMERAMRRGLDASQALLPASVDIAVYQVTADRVADRISVLLRNGLSGLLLVALILFLFLNARIAIWVAAGVPVAVFATIGLMFATGQSVNMISLFALIMTLGIVVDDAIVVGEHTATRLAAGDDPETAAIAGAMRMFTPVLAAMLTTVAAFAPIFLISQELGQIMSQLPMVAIAVLVASLIECFLILPGHLAHSLKPRAPRRFLILRSALFSAPLSLLFVTAARSEGFAQGIGFDVFPEPFRDFATQHQIAFSLAVITVCWLVTAWLLARAQGPHSAQNKGRGFRERFDRGFDWCRRALLEPLVRSSVRFPYLVTAISVGVLIVCIGLLRSDRIPFVFFPAPEAENIFASVTLHPGVGEEAAMDVLMTLETSLEAAERALSPEGDPLIEAVFVELGDGGSTRGDNLALIEVQLVPTETRTVRTADIMDEWRAKVPALPQLRQLAISEARLGPPGRDIDVRFFGAEPAVLKKASLDLQRALQRFPGIYGVEDDLPYGKPELELRLTDRGAALGFTVEEVGRQIRDAVEGRIARRIAVQDEEITVRVKMALPPGIGSLRDLELKSPDGEFAPLSTIADLTERQGFAAVYREAGRPVVSVVANIDSAQMTSSQIETALSDGPLPSIAEQYGVTYRFAGRAEERQEAFADLGLGSILALSTIYIILAWLFGHYIRPVAVMFIIPFGLVGAVLGHLVMEIPLTILSFIGLLGLTGILVNDSIILVARFTERLRSGDSFEDAAVGASGDRFRAVILTSLTTIAGLAPLLMEQSLQAQLLIPMATTIVFGLGSATIFVLLLIPAILAIGEDAEIGLGLR
ncbi:MAG: efflux RND transporter permease subunit [Pseudomonadota bacterium]